MESSVRIAQEEEPFQSAPSVESRLRVGTTKSVGFAHSAEERDSISGPSMHNDQLKELDAPALAGDAKAEDGCRPRQ